MKNCVSIKLKKDKIIIKIQEDALQEEIIDCLKRKLTGLNKLYQVDQTPIVVTGKVLKNKEVDEIQELIKSRINVEVEFDTPTSLGLYSIKKTFNREIAISETKFHKGSLRSGQKIEAEGSIVILR